MPVTENDLSLLFHKHNTSLYSNNNDNNNDNNTQVHGMIMV